MKFSVVISAALTLTPLALGAAISSPNPGAAAEALPDTLVARKCGDGAYCMGVGGGAKCNE